MKQELRACAEISTAKKIMNFHLAATEGLIQAQMTLEKAGGKAMQFSNAFERVRALYQPATQLGG